MGTQQQFQLSVRDESKITFTRLPEATTIKRTSSVWLHCQAVSKPLPKITWKKDFKTLTNKTNKQTVFPNGTLYINSLRKENTYTCFAETKDANGKLMETDDRSALVRIAMIKPFSRENQH